MQKIPQLFIFFMSFKKNLILFLIFFAIHTHIFAQRDEIGGHIGAMTYRGEVSSFSMNSAGASAGIFVRQNWNEAFSSRYTATFGKIRASDANSDDKFQKARNYSFTTAIFELSAQAEYNFFPFRSPSHQQLWSPYLFTGLAYFRMTPQKNSNPDYSLNQIAIPFGVGAKFVIGENWNLAIEFSARKTFTDNLDDLNITTTIPTQPRSVKGFTGNPYDKDMYFTSSFMIGYTIYKVRCPRFYNL